MYIFYYKVKNGIERISYTYIDDDDNEKYGKIGDTDKLIDFIKRNCQKCTDVYFDGFDSGKIIYILNQISEIIEVNYPPIDNDGPYQMIKRQTKIRSRKNGLD